MKSYSKFLVVCFIFFSMQINAQERVIHGIVTALENIPMAGVEIKIKSSKQTVLTDTLGGFSIGCNHNDKIIVTANGFYKQKVKLKKHIKYAAINLKMMPGAKGKAFAIGYGHVLEPEKISAVGTLSEDDFDFSQYNNIYELIKGRIPGVQILNGKVIIRGLNSINSSSAATILLDGTTVNESVLSSLSPNQVKRISVIKDGSAAIYGFKGSNGVLIIETKMGNRVHD